jgi:glycerol-1-phosphate dehydrogenase [NAD(P)+]
MKIDQLIPQKLLGSTFACKCGLSHHVPTRQIIYAEGALERLPGVLGKLVEGRNIVLVADERTRDIAGRTAELALGRAGWTVRSIVVPDGKDGSPVCDDVTHDRLNEQFKPADTALGIGCGVINDLTKWSAYEHDLPYAVVATAATMNGFTAANVAPTVSGVKTLIPARPPVAVFAVPSILIQAPYKLTAAGLGDTIAKPMSTADWLLNHIFCEEYFCSYCSEIINALETYYLNRPEDIKNREPPAIEALFNALMYSGIAMTLVGTSAPSSGGEHLLSHTLDMMSSVDGTAHDLHGRQVGLGTIFSAALFSRVLTIGNPEINRMPSNIDVNFWGGRAENVQDQYRQKAPANQIMSQKLKDERIWRAFVDAASKQVRPPGQIKQCLKSAGAAHTFADIGCSRERFIAAARHMHEIRKRPTIVDLAWMLGILPDAADDIIDTWLTS